MPLIQLHVDDVHPPSHAFFLRGLRDLRGFFT